VICNRLLITGTTGMLGKQFLKFFNEKCDNVYTLNRSDGDLLNFEFVKNFVLKIKPDVIIHCIADTNLSRCQKKQEDTLLLHCGLTHSLSSFGSRMVYISTSSALDPCNFYDKTKLLGEKICLLNNADNLVIRTNIYGFGSSSSSSLFEWAFDGFKNKLQITGYSDVCFNAIYTKQLVRVVYKLLLSNHKGIINVAGDYSISKYAFLDAVCKTFNFDNSLLLKESAPVDGFVKRNRNITLNVCELRNDYGISLGLEEGLIELKKDLENK